MAMTHRPLTFEDKCAAMKAITRSLPGRYAEELAQGIIDVRLTEVLENAFGIEGGCSPAGLPWITYRGAGLKVWIDWNTCVTARRKPTFQGEATLRMVRHIRDIPDPADDQLRLF